ncbi:MAG: hypothetical protein KAS72_04595 [Phycisphaerales bacterium]|nr:hypothetical protein [Phycisphaerales bacterium]
MRRFVWLIVVLDLAGCVVDDSPRGAGELVVPVPQGVVQPAVGARTRTDIARFALMPLGTIRYDGQVLPIVSPDGRHIASQTGGPATWRALLASDGAIVPDTTRIEFHRLTTTGIERVGEAPTGLLLGRNCDDLGFLVEAVQPDGSRWIGSVTWETGDLTWIARDEAVNAFAHRGPSGRIAWCRRAIGEDGFDLVIQQGAGRYVIPADKGSYLMPVWGSRPDLLYVLRIELAGALNVLALRLAGDLTAHEVIAAQTLASQGDPAHAYQAFAGSQEPAGQYARTSAGLLLFHPVQQRMACFDPQRSVVQLVDAQTVAGAWLRDGKLLLTTTDLLLLRDLKAEQTGAIALRSPYIPRTTPHHAMPVILLAHQKRGQATFPGHLRIVRLAFADDESP